MWESFVEIDYHLLRTALCLGLLLTVLLPAAFYYISYGYNRLKLKKDNEVYRNTSYTLEKRNQCKTNPITQFISLIRRKQPQNSDEPLSILLS
ncbi:hypothetical protein JOC77_002848 [Peribacillus deserti]|uniref:Uncharacterized protein n=1 Tax=Peribacillus deserti TaxID=673318 RepID=A0ABS2QJR0_9BACI|nr:hypothetical protein [Peribacillus deserti]